MITDITMRLKNADKHKYRPVQEQHTVPDLQCMREQLFETENLGNTSKSPEKAKEGLLISFGNKT